MAIRMAFRSIYIALRAGLLAALVLIVLLLGMLYLYSPVYDFPSAKPFAGDRFYNPYAGADLSRGFRANFHAHTRSYDGITDGRSDTNEAISNLYRFLGYKTFSISDYQKINGTNSDQKWYIPVYEHGFSIGKNHQICLGAKKVLWFDFPLFQGVNQEQYVLDLLRNKTDLIALAHPCIRKSYSSLQLSQLTNYDLVEALNYFCNSEPQWDAALSAGRRVYVVAGDDVHNLANTNQVGGKFNMVVAASNRRRDVLASLKSGKSYGVDLARIDQEPYRNKRVRMDLLAKVLGVTVEHNLLRVKLNRKVSEIDFIGQRGRLLERVLEQSDAQYAIRPADPYVRIRIELPDRTHYYLNPITRYSGERPPVNPRASVNLARTWAKRILGLGLVAWVADREIRRKRMLPAFMTRNWREMV